MNKKVGKSKKLSKLSKKSRRNNYYFWDSGPRTLLTVDYKILSSVLATRLKPTLNDLIHEDQTGFIKGRHMSER